MKKSYLALLAPGVFVLIAGLFVLMLFVVKILWAWTIPDLFPGAVEQGLIAGSISWLTSLKIAIFIAILGGIMGGCKKSSD